MTFPGVDWKTIGRLIKAQSKLGEVDWDEISRVMKNQIRKDRKRRVKKIQEPPPPIIKIRVINKYVYVPAPSAADGSEPIEGGPKKRGRRSQGKVSTPKVAGPKRIRKRAPKRSTPEDPNLWKKAPPPTTVGLPKTIPEDAEGLEDYILDYLPEEALRLDRRSFNHYSDHHGVRLRLTSQKDETTKLALDTLTAVRRRALARKYAYQKRAKKQQVSSRN